MNLDDIREESGVRIHYMADDMPLSSNKFKAVWKICKKNGIRTLERAEYFLPIIRYHSRWQELTVEDFTPDSELYPFMSSSFHIHFLRYSRDVEESVLEEKGAEVQTEIAPYFKAVID